MIFLCYAKEDKPTVDGVYVALRKAGLDPWMDKPPPPFRHLGIKPGASWDLVIRENIERADLIFAFLSKTSLEKRGYVQREYRLALNAMAQLPPTVVKFVPVLLEPCQPHALRVDTVSFGDFQWFELYDQGLDDLIRLASDQWGADPRDIALRSIDRDLWAAAELQRSTIRVPTDLIPGYELAHWFEAAGQVAGDFMAVRRRPDGSVLIAHGDVAGKGIRAAMSSHAITAMLADAANSVSGPGEIASRLNELGPDLLGRSRFATVFLGVLDPDSGRLDYVSAGQRFARLADDGSAQLCDSTGVAIGMLSLFEFPETSLSLDEGTTLALFSDGIYEALDSNEDEYFGEERLMDMLAEGNREALEVSCERVRVGVREFEGRAVPVDDQALLLVRRRRKAGG